jgi:hypothetical protein
VTKRDASINIGINLDEAQFLNAYESVLAKTSAITQARVQDTVTSLKGPATKNWDTLPYYTMHDRNAGNRAASRAFVASMGEDLRRQGVKAKSAEYESALISAAYRSSTPDPMERYHKMLANGHYEAADLSYPGTALSQAVESNYALMEQDWSRDFLKKRKSKGLDPADLQKLTKKDIIAQGALYGLQLSQRDKKQDLINKVVAQSQEPSVFIDFAGMREYAVEHGLGKWKDSSKEHTADNFELINKELEKIGKGSELSGKNFKDWGESLKGALGTLTAIGGLLSKVGAAVVGGVVTANKMSEREVTRGAERADARRAFVGMDTLDQLESKVASRAVSLGEDAIYNEVISMSEARQKYKLLGQGDALPPALLGIFDNLMNSDNPYEAYKSAADEIYANLRAIPDDRAQERERILMLMDNMGLGSMSHLVGQFLSNPDYAQKYGAPSNLFNLQSNPYYNYYNQAETMVPDLAKLNESIKASYLKMATDWQESFGVPFKTWWDNLLKDTIAPWADKLEKILGRSIRSALGKQTDMEEAKNNINAIRDLFTTFGGDTARMEAIEANSGNISNTQAGSKGSKYRYTKGSTWDDYLAGTSLWRNRAFVNKDYAGMVPKKGANIDFNPTNKNAGTVTNAYWNDFVRLANKTDEDLASAHDMDKESVSRLKKMVARLNETHLSDFLKDSTYQDMDKYLIRGVTMGLYDSDDWETNFEAMINSALRTSLNAQTDEEIVKLLREISGNTAVANLMYNDPELRTFIQNRYPEFYANRMLDQLHFGTDNSTVQR